MENFIPFATSICLNKTYNYFVPGTGHVTSTYVERLRGVSLVVRSETDGSLLLESKIQPVSYHMFGAILEGSNVWDDDKMLGKKHFQWFYFKFLN